MPDSALGVETVDGLVDGAVEVGGFNGSAVSEVKARESAPLHLDVFQLGRLVRGPFDVAQDVTGTTDQGELVAEARASGDSAVIRRALNIVARARGTSGVASSVGQAVADIRQLQNSEAVYRLGPKLGFNVSLRDSHADISREGLYKALSEDGVPKLRTVPGVLSGPGIGLSAEHS